MKKSLLVVTSQLLLSVAACTRLSPSKSYLVLGNTPAVLQAAFNADADKVRVLMLVSPTCGVCLRGASEVSEQLVKLKKGKDAAEFVVWVPRLGAREKNVSPATQVVAASWAQQYLGWERPAGSAVQTGARMER